MKRLVLFGIVGLMTAGLCSCGSTWTISGNNVTVHKLETDTVIPAGSYVITDCEHSFN